MKTKKKFHSFNISIKITVKPVYNGHPEKRGRYAEGFMKKISGK
jgi:hypothetical protein